MGDGAPTGTAQSGAPASPQGIEADKLLPAGNVGEVHLEPARERVARLWGGLIILIGGLIISGGAITLGGDESTTADRGWNLLFLIVGYAGAYIFKDSRTRQ